MALCNSCTYQDYYTEEMQCKSVMRPSMHRYFLQSFFERKRLMIYLEPIQMMGWLYGRLEQIERQNRARLYT